MTVPNAQELMRDQEALGTCVEWNYVEWQFGIWLSFIFCSRSEGGVSSIIEYYRVLSSIWVDVILHSHVRPHLPPPHLTITITNYNNYNLIITLTGIQIMKFKPTRMQKLCEFEGCLICPSTNYIDCKGARFCVGHKLRGMVDKLNRRCEVEGCPRTALFNFPGVKDGRFCGEHRHDGMINVKGRVCENPECIKTPYFNEIGTTKGRFCSEHKQVDMVNVVSRRCEMDGCNKIPKFNINGARSGRYCSNHKQPGMHYVEKIKR